MALLHQGKTNQVTTAQKTPEMSSHTFRYSFCAPGTFRVNKIKLKMLIQKSSGSIDCHTRAHSYPSWGKVYIVKQEEWQQIDEMENKYGRLTKKE